MRRRLIDFSRLWIPVYIMLCTRLSPLLCQYSDFPLRLWGVCESF